MREINVKEITSAIKEMCITVNHDLSDDMKDALKKARETEVSPVSQKVLSQLEENLVIAKEKTIPICQATGMAVVFLELGYLCL